VTAFGLKVGRPEIGAAHRGQKWAGRSPIVFATYGLVMSNDTNSVAKRHTQKST